MRVYFCGASSVGKTTLARLVAKKYKLHLLHEVARNVLAERQYPGGLAAMAGDLGEVTSYQVEVFERQIAAEDSAGDDFVSDRMADNLVYAAIRAEAGTVHRLLAKEDGYLERVRSGIVFFVRPHRHLLRNDGVRADAVWDEVLRQDGAVMMLLHLLHIPYIPISCPEIADRLRVVEAVLRVI